VTGAAGGTTVIDAVSAFAYARLRVCNIETRRAPGRSIVAILTIGAKCTNVEYRIFMASYTLSRETGELSVCMALFTGYIYVRAIQRKIAAVVIEGGRIPARWCVTGTAIRAKAAVVFVILLMAGVTLSGRTLKDTVLVAILAVNSGMHPFQFEGRQVVIEGGVFPIIWRVTGAAICAKLTIMRVVCAVAGIAILGCGLKVSQTAGIFMTGDTLHFSMSASQLKVEGIMTEIFSKYIYTVVTIQTGCAKGLDMCLGKDGVHLTVAGVACV